MRTNLLITTIVILSVPCHQILAGPFLNIGISGADSELLLWADSVAEFNPTLSGSDLETKSNALGPADGGFTSLGDLTAEELSLGKPAGSIVLGFSNPFFDGPGWDFAVFENAGQFFAAPLIFGELSYVEVSSNGSDFVSFPNESFNVEPGNGNAENELSTAFGRNFAGINPGNVKNLAGIHPQGMGTAFDLNDLAGTVGVLSGAVDLDAIRFVRLTDIPGDGSRLDSNGQMILDAWPTGGEVGGFDLDALGVRYPISCDTCPSLGDFDLDGVIDVDDVERLSEAIVDSNATSNFDLNEDGTTDFEDLSYWVEVVANTYMGDRNIDGEFNSEDLIQIFQAGEYEDGIIGNSTWSTGDSNGDGEFDSRDMIVAFQSGGYEKGPRPSATLVPEPTTFVAFLFGVFMILGSLRAETSTVVQTS